MQTQGMYTMHKPLEKSSLENKGTALHLHSDSRGRSFGSHWVRQLQTVSMDFILHWICSDLMKMDII